VTGAATPPAGTRFLAISAGADLGSLAGLRERLSRFLGGGLSQPRRLDALMLATELVSNAVRHAPPGPVRLSAVLDAGRLRVEVEDPGPGLVPDWQRTREDAGGLGLDLVSVLAERWGFSSSPPSSVWFELDARPGRDPLAHPRGRAGAASPPPEPPPPAL